MNGSTMELFRTIESRSFIWVAPQERLLNDIDSLFTHAGGDGKDLANLLKAHTLESPIPKAGEHYFLAISEYVGKSVAPSSAWFEFCALARIAYTTLGKPLTPIQGGILAIITARFIHYNDTTGFMPYSRSLFSFFPLRTGAKDKSAVQFVLRPGELQDRFDFGYSPVDFLAPGSLILSFWKA